MAEPQIDTVMLTSNSKILVTVDEALQDILVVSYAFESRLFQGVLLDSTKRYLPCRIGDNVNAASTDPKAETSEEDKLYFSIRQRFTYFQEKHVNHIHLQKKVTSKSKNQKMTVRLRPRQVLCSKCKSICSENSENVNSHKTRSSSKNPPEPPPETSPGRLFTENRRDNLSRVQQPQLTLPNSSPSPSKLCPSFVPRIPRSQRNSDNSENSKPLNGSSAEVKEEDGFWLKPQEMEDGQGPGNGQEEEDRKMMVLRKKRSVGSMEDLWDETVFEEGSKKAKTTPVIKISFGSQGEGTVLKIPPKVQGSESEPEEKPKSIQDSKAAKKAMKKAKKEAKKKTLGSPMRTRRSSTPEPEELQYRKHRHKMKHKKKHKGDKADEDMKERCLKQKLSINLKRVTPTTYERAESSSSGSDSASPLAEEVPDFPEAGPIEGTSDVSSCKTMDGSVVAVGDIIWGKIPGCPWWPGKILNIVIQSENDSWHAHVSWFGSTTSSMMPCDQLSPFLQSFKVRYNKRKKSAGYKEAIRQATTEASASNPELPLPEGLVEDGVVVAAS